MIKYLCKLKQFSSAVVYSQGFMRINLVLPCNIDSSSKIYDVNSLIDQNRYCRYITVHIQIYYCSYYITVRI